MKAFSCLGSVVFAILSFVSSASAQVQAIVPPQDGYVNDYASFLTPEEEEELESQLRKYTDSTGYKIYFLGVPTFGDEDSYDLGFLVSEKWKLTRDKSKTVLFMLTRDGKPYIYTPSVVDGPLPLEDAIRLEQVIKNGFNSGDAGDEIRRGVELIQRLIYFNDNEVQTEKENFFLVGKFVGGLTLIFLAFISLIGFIVYLGKRLLGYNKGIPPW